MELGSFRPIPGFNICDHCIYRKDRKDSDLPCRTCPNNAKYLDYRRIDYGA